MELEDIQSRDLLPKFANQIAWVNDAFDVIVRDGNARRITLDAPLTRESIANLTDEELQEYYAYYGIAIYYPDLARSTRENLLYEMAKNYRFLGTPHTIELLCRYIFDENERVEIEIKDNLAWDSAGNLKNEALLDIFDIAVEFREPSLDDNAYQRIIDNVFNFVRNSQTLRGIQFNWTIDLPTTHISYTDGGNFERFFTMSTFGRQPAPKPNANMEVLTGYIQGGSLPSGTMKTLYADDACTTTIPYPTGYALVVGGYKSGGTWIFDEVSSISLVNNTNISITQYTSGTMTIEAVKFVKVPYVEAWVNLHSPITINFGDSKITTNSDGCPIPYTRAMSLYKYYTSASQLGSGKPKLEMDSRPYNISGLSDALFITNRDPEFTTAIQKVLATYAKTPQHPLHYSLLYFSNITLDSDITLNYQQTAICYNTSAQKIPVPANELYVPIYYQTRIQDTDRFVSCNFFADDFVMTKITENSVDYLGIRSKKNGLRLHYIYVLRIPNYL